MRRNSSKKFIPSVLQNNAAGEPILSQIVWLNYYLDILFNFFFLYYFFFCYHSSTPTFFIRTALRQFNCRNSIRIFEMWRRGSFEIGLQTGKNTGWDLAISHWDPRQKKKENEVLKKGAKKIYKYSMKNMVVKYYFYSILFLILKIIQRNCPLINHEIYLFNQLPLKLFFLPYYVHFLIILNTK